MGVFELALAMAPRSEEKHLEDWLTTIKILTNWLLDNEKKLGDVFFKKAFINIDEGIQSFWSMKNSIITNPDNYSFQEIIENQFDCLDKIIEKMIRFEGYLISSKNHFDDTGEVYSDFSSNKAFKHCESFFKDYDSIKINDEKLLSIQVTQWRNIAAHKSYSCRNNEISISYGNYPKIKKRKITQEDLQQVILEVYRFRINIKLSLGIVLTTVLWKSLSAIDLVEFSSRGFLMDLNYFIRDLGVNIIRFESVSAFNIEGECKIATSDCPEHHLYEIEFESTIDEPDSLAKIIFNISEMIILMFNEHNSLPKKEEVMFYFQDKKRNPQFHMVRSFD